MIDARQELGKLVAIEITVSTGCAATLRSARSIASLAE